MKYHQRGGTRHHIVLEFPNLQCHCKEPNLVETWICSTQTQLQLQDQILQLHPGAQIWSWAAPEDYIPVREEAWSAS